MNIDRINSVLNHLEMALDTVRQELADSSEDDTILRQNEITLECLHKDWSKRFYNARQLMARRAS